ncbi:hypothetical protein GCM10007973_23770 [Polymorphobacter multimanifer]|uniref:4-hydroxybenzoate polyprenyltransferase n=1 Tax=Polymorphobacter multimanifer TaxID=1070431 RepID=A0A841L8W4_9SPHN|nr:UbiA family prenyltransferase [Polymorphobacter multimanifer]MBB6226275.1 4-hydroxybenzoate polyprenyltransferase [Polymorphobacter multimanifer]GGI86552.1 hypothetical protein GCM10007973_23770 [Polymorphobacter multimanifer]
MASTNTARQSTRSVRLADYVAIARLDHITKQVFIIPGIVLAYLISEVRSPDVVMTVLLGFVCAISIASANYTINEYLDRDFDALHPTKSARTAVQVGLDPRMVALQWLVLVLVGLAAAGFAGRVMFIIACVFAAQGIVYNVRPSRSKDVPYFDVISEAINNPLRMMIGWAMIDPYTIAPSSMLLVYWTGGGFLMTAKRLSEYRDITASHGRDLLARYRASFAGYTAEKLIVACLIYALLSGFFLAVFLIKYRIEYVLALPVFAALFGHYMSLSLQANSVAQKPEHLFRERRLIAVVAILTMVLAFCTFVEMPWLDILLRKSVIVIA